MKRAILVTTLIFLLLILLGMIFTVYSYFQWRKDFNSLKESTLICSSNLEFEREVFENKIREFIVSNEKTEFVVFSKEEILGVLKGNIKTNGDFEVEDICLSSNIGEWRVYINTRLIGVDIPWVSFSVMKENRESAEIYIKDMYFTEYVIPKYISGDMIRDINLGITDGLILSNENSFLGRSIENIELKEDAVIVKGSI